MTIRVAIYVQHLLGTGHYVRALALAQGMAARGFGVTLITGGMPVEGTPGPGINKIQLPPIRSADASFSGLVMEDGTPLSEKMKARRTDALCAAMRAAEPDAVITELFPFGRRQMRFELIPLMDALRATPHPPLMLSSIRDILIAPSQPEKLEKSLKLFETYFEGALVHGDPQVIRLEDSYPLPVKLAGKLHYTGYVTQSRAEALPGDTGFDGRDEIIVAAGGGAVGGRLMEAALEACRDGAGEGRRWRFLLGTLLPEIDRMKIMEASDTLEPDRMIAEPARPDYRELLARAAVSVSQGGYNTMMDVLITGVPAVIVPFAEGNESEQTTRARLFAERGLAVHLDEVDLSGKSLKAAIDEALVLPKPKAGQFRLDGAEETARIVEEWVKRRA